MFSKIQISRTKLKVAYNKNLSKVAKDKLGNNPTKPFIRFRFARPEGIGSEELERKIEFAKGQYSQLAFF